MEDWKDKLIWIDDTRRTAKDELNNYIEFMKNYPEVKDKFVRRGNKYYFDGREYDTKTDNYKIKTLLKIVTGLTNSQLFTVALNEIKRTCSVEENDNTMMIADTFVDEWQDINKNISDKELILDIMNTMKIEPDEKNTSDEIWEKYKEWINTEAKTKINTKNEITGYDDCYSNIVNWLLNYPLFKDKLVYNEVREKVQINNTGFDESKLHYILQTMNKHFLPKYSNISGMNNAIMGAGCMNHYNPVQEYFKTLKYDNSRNWIRWFIEEVLRCPETEYYDLYEFELTTFMVAFIKRNVEENFEKDIKFDNILALTSEVGGSGKSSVFEELFKFNGIPYCDGFDTSDINFKDKDLLMNMHQTACVNFDEISMSRKLVNGFKTFLQKTRDNYRVPYGHTNEERLRHFVFAATSNNNDFLKDYTSITERRWWIIHISEDSSNGVRINNYFHDKELNLTNKLWSQAMEIYRNEPNRKLWLYDTKLQEDLDKIQENYKATNNSDYNEIKNILDSQWGFYDDEDVSVDAIVEQYNHTGGAMDWCKLHNEQITKLRNKEGYIMTPNDKLIQYFGHIDKISSSKLHNILKKLNLNFTIPSLKNVLKKTWDADKAARISGKVTCSYVRKEKFDDKYKLEIDNYGNINETTYDNTGLPF